ncbi:MAG: hypothetical protein CVU56_02350 [Deltaproteobacteria bacterium HGW-Deltaproteobacteria-14]|jgi:hypothetical protein|nr:MAG: hypothetical protein CVU56_02350 [Deltaproteobacteria bacterium HGW-Deltaproteobacteria-14]
MASVGAALWLAVVGVACGDGGSGAIGGVADAAQDTASQGDAAIDAAIDAAVAVDAATDTVADDGADAADGDGIDAPDLVDATPPAPLVLSDVTFTASKTNPLAGVLSVTTNRPARLGVTWVEVGRDGPPAAVPTSPALAMQHSVWILGLAPESEFVVTVSAVDGDGHAALQQAATVATDALPASLPQFTLVASDAAAVAPGLTLLLPRSATSGGPRGMIVIIDHEARPRWLFTQDQQVHDVRLSPRGTLLYMDRAGLTELDMAGRAVRHVERTAIPADTLHHAILELPDGHLLTLSTELRGIDGYPPEVAGGGLQNVVGDLVLDIAPDGTLATSWALLDLLDPHHVAAGFTDSGYDNVYPGATPTRDWSHANALHWDAGRGVMLVCLRHQHQIVALDRGTGAVRWRLGEGGDFTLAAGGAWFHGPHAAQLTASGDVLLFDNGFGRPLEEGGEYSRAVELAIDDAADPPTAEVVWEWRGEAPFYSPVMGDADQLANGDVLVTVAAYDEAGSDDVGARLVEVTHEASPRVVWDVRVGHPTARYQVYQADRIDGVYPPELLTAP